MLIYGWKLQLLSLNNFINTEKTVYSRKSNLVTLILKKDILVWVQLNFSYIP